MADETPPDQSSTGVSGGDSVTQGNANSPLSGPSGLQSGPFPNLQPGQTPPIPPGQSPQALALMIQHGINFAQPQQNPETMRYITEFLTADSNNKLSAIDSKGKRNHTFRMTIVICISILSVIVLSIPLVSMYRGNMDFVKDFLDKYFQQMVIIALALLGGGKLFEILR